MKNIYIIENLFTDSDEVTSDQFNELVVGKISTHSGWYISNDEQRQNIFVDGDYSDSGMLLESYFSQNPKKSEIHDDVNFIASMIYQKILETLPFNFVNPKVVRYLWNYYNRSSTGVPHKDMGDNITGNFCSMVYHLNTCDGKTMIGEDVFTSKSGQCVVFDSKRLHQGVGPKVSSKRFCLNIVIEYDSIIDK